MLIDAIDWLGHSGFRVRAGRSTVYLDPYRAGDRPPADLILVTHGHQHHFSPEDVERLSHDGTWVVGPPAVAERTAGKVISVRPGEELRDELVPGVSVATVAAYNTSKRDAGGNPFHPREAGWVGYELTVRGERLYHAGDTDVIPEMDRVSGVDVALLPVSGVCVMTPGEAAEAARRIQPRVAVPMHWGGHVGSRDDAQAFADKAPVEVKILDRSA